VIIGSEWLYDLLILSVLVRTIVIFLDIHFLFMQISDKIMYASDMSVSMIILLNAISYQKSYFLNQN
jgi:hypothetical protein